MAAGFRDKKKKWVNTWRAKSKEDFYLFENLDLLRDWFKWLGTFSNMPGG